MLLPRGTNPYLVKLNEIARSFVEKNRFDAQIKSYFINSFDPDELAAALRRLARNSDGVIFMTVDHPKVRSAFDDIAAAGKRVVTLISDTRAMLLDGTMVVVITQNSTILFEAATEAACKETKRAVSMELYISENLPLS